MLQIKGIRKVYKTGSLTQEALKGVSLSLRDSEFVAILGASGSGKTTLLNIIGGLDRYDEGDLIINGISTKKYRDRDWDSYRNHTVGFVFQSYNLIPHQSVLKNVELALTIGGISSRERTERATQALDKVGLHEHIHKKPSQLSGGQMQRVAIARALVNDPDILLADEPTGALDSETSLQVMDLLQEVARDRLVVMVTHNPELAEQYATRIVTLKDGAITSDSDPYTPDAGETVHKNMGRASMSLLTALSLSFNNLWTKKTRTILVAFAGSIGIIGIALILSMSHGANQYIRSVEEESLQSYPLQITDTSFSLASMYAESAGAAGKAQPADGQDVEEWRTITTMLSGVNANDLKSLRAYFESADCDIYDYVQALEYSYNLSPQIYKVSDDGYRQVNPDKSFSALGFSGTEGSTNGLLSTFSSTDTFFALPEKEALYTTGFDLKAGSWPKAYNECVVVLSVNGRVSDMTLYTLGLKDPDELDRLVKNFADGKSNNVDAKPGTYRYEDFWGIEFSLVSACDYYTYDSQYKVWSDHSADESYMKKMLEHADTMRVVGVIQPAEDNTSPILNVGIGYHADLTGHIIDMAARSDIVKAQLADPDTNVFTGKRFDDENKTTDPDLSALFSVDRDAISKAFDFDPSDLNFDMSTADPGNMDFQDLDLSRALSGAELSRLFPSLSSKDIQDILSEIDFTITADTLGELFEQLLAGYADYAGDNPRADLGKLGDGLYSYLGSEELRDILRNGIRALIAARADEMITQEDIESIVQRIADGYPAYVQQYHPQDITGNYLVEYIRSAEAEAIMQTGAEDLRDKLKAMTPTQDEVTEISIDLLDGYESYATDHDLPSASSIMEHFLQYMDTDEAKALITSAVASATDNMQLQKSMDQYTGLMADSVSRMMQTVMSSVSGQVSNAIRSSMSGLITGMSKNMLSVLTPDPAAFANMFKMNMTGEELRDLMMSLMSTQETNYDSNLKKLGYADYDRPSMITIYPSDFDSKKQIKDIISDYNRRMEKAGEDDKVIEYTDLVDALMGSVTTIIDAISYVLIAFVAISLVVSSIMIGVITYISVLERRKEIGILRAIGASKRNISQVFNAETFIIGALAGLIGIGITYILIIPANALLHSLVEQANIRAILPPSAAAILVVLSIVLTLIGGIIPSRKAAKSDPVTALRAD